MSDTSQRQITLQQSLWKTLINSCSIYASTPFKFAVDGSPYHIHAGLVSHLSHPLDRMINGPMAEAQKGYAVLEDVEKGTFERFMEWAYKGYYKAADFAIEAISPPPVPRKKKKRESTTVIGEEVPSVATALELHDDVELAGRGELRSDWDNWLGNPKMKKGKDAEATQNTTQELKESFLRHKYTVRRDTISIPPARANRGELENYTGVSLSHARLYVFAEKYDIQALRMLAPEELHHILTLHAIYRCRTGDIIALLRYVYANTRAPAGGDEELRMLVRDYMGYEMSGQMQDEDFKDLMIEDRGALLGDFMEMVALRID